MSKAWYVAISVITPNSAWSSREGSSECPLCRTTPMTSAVVNAEATAHGFMSARAKAFSAETYRIPRSAPNCRTIGGWSTPRNRSSCVPGKTTSRTSTSPSWYATLPGGSGELSSGGSGQICFKILSASLMSRMEESRNSAAPQASGAGRTKPRWKPGGLAMRGTASVNEKAKASRTAMPQVPGPAAKPSPWSMSMKTT